MTKMATTKSSVLTLIRDMSMSLAGNFEKLGHQLPKRLSQLYIKYEPNAIIVKETHHHHPTHIHIGQRAPDHTVKQGEEEKHLFQLFKGIHHTLLIFSGKKPTVEELKNAEELSSSLKDFPHIQSYLVYRNDENFLSSPAQVKALLDREPSIHSHYGITKATALLVRPDGYIGYIQEPLDIKKFHQYLNQIFIEGKYHDPLC